MCLKNKSSLLKAYTKVGGGASPPFFDALLGHQRRASSIKCPIVGVVMVDCMKQSTRPETCCHFIRRKPKVSHIFDHWEEARSKELHEPV